MTGDFMEFLPVIQPGGADHDAHGHDDHEHAAGDAHSHAHEHGHELATPPIQTNVLPLASMHLRGGWHPAPVHSFTVPLWFRGTYDEQQAARESAVILDRSHLGRFYVTGDRAAEVLARVLATDARRLAPGTIARAVACREDGTVLDIPTLCHIDPGRWLVITGPRAQVRLRLEVEAAVRPDDDVVVRDRLEESVLLSVQGPASAVLLDAAQSPHLGQAIRDRLEEGHDRIADLHVWRLGPGHHGAIVVLVSDAPKPVDHYKDRLSDVGGLSHVTIEVNRCNTTH